MELFHFTSAGHLHAISEHGLTVGDVPTDQRRWKGRVGVWLTCDSRPEGHGLEGFSVDKTRYRLTVSVADDDPLLKRWLEWSRKYVTKETREMLHNTAASFETWFIYFGHVKPTAITRCTDMQTGEDLPDWPERFPSTVKPIPYSQRQRWHKALMKQIQRELARRGY